MRRTRILRGVQVSVLLLTVPWQAAAQDEQRSVENPRWTYEIRGGYFYPDLDLFETFYGDDKESYYGLAGSYRFRDWLEVGGEYSQMRAKGVGILTSSQQLGGTVEYRLNPIHVYANFIFQRQPEQRFVPYVGIALTVANYEQDVELQPGRDGRTDLDYSARIGIRFSLTSHGPRMSSASSESPYWRSYLFLEAQQIKAEVDNIELGGEAYVLGFRMEFDFSGRRR